MRGVFGSDSGCILPENLPLNYRGEDMIKKIKKSKNQYVYIRNFYLASFLFLKGLDLMDTTKDKRFVFKDSLRRKDLMRDYNFAKVNTPRVMVDARKFVWAMKTLRERTYQ